MMKEREQVTKEQHTALIDACNLLYAFSGMNLPPGWEIDITTRQGEAELTIVKPICNADGTPPDSDHTEVCHDEPEPVKQVRDKERVFLTVSQALTFLPEGDTIHTYLHSVGGMLIGAYWSRSDLLKGLASAIKIEIGGQHCREANHGLVMWRDAKTAVYVECRPSVDYDSVPEV